MSRADRRAGQRPRRTLVEPVPAGAAIAGALAARGLTEELRAHDLVARWDDVVGPRIANRAWPDGLSKRVLWIRVQSSAWLHELTMLRAQLTKTIRDAMGAPPLFDELRLHLGGRPHDAGDLLPVTVPKRPRRAAPPPIPARGERAAAIEAETSAIADDDLRELVRRVRLRNDR